MLEQEIKTEQGKEMMPLHRKSMMEKRGNYFIQTDFLQPKQCFAVQQLKDRITVDNAEKAKGVPQKAKYKYLDRGLWTIPTITYGTC